MTDYSPPLAGAAQDETLELRPKFNADGLIAAIAQDAASGDVLMLAWMNAEALAATLATGRATYWSRSRGALRVNQTGGACHTGRDSCFYRAVGADGQALSLDTNPD